MSEQTRYTLREARREIVRIECANEGHRPDQHMATVENAIGVYFCACGEIMWAPTT